MRAGSGGGGLQAALHKAAAGVPGVREADRGQAQRPLHRPVL